MVCYRWRAECNQQQKQKKNVCRNHFHCLYAQWSAFSSDFLSVWLHMCKLLFKRAHAHVNIYGSTYRVSGFFLSFFWKTTLKRTFFLLILLPFLQKIIFGHWKRCLHSNAFYGCYQLMRCAQWMLTIKCINILLYQQSFKKKCDNFSVTNSKFRADVQF